MKRLLLASSLALMLSSTAVLAAPGPGGHGHGDHFAGAGYFQEHYGTKVATTAADWDLIYPPNRPANQDKQDLSRPRRDVVLKEGQDVTLGDETVHVVS